VVYEWDAKKAKGNRRKHRISFEDAATVFLDPLALTFPDPDHSMGEEREITIGRSSRQQVVFVSHCRRGTASESSAHGKPLGESASNMKKASAKGTNSDLRPEYDLSQLKGGVRGKYYARQLPGPTSC